MTNDEIQTILDAHQKMILTMAQICHRRLRQPTIYDIKDLVQEAMTICIKALPSFDDTRSSIKTFIFQCVMRHFANLIRFSWFKKHDNSQYQPNIQIKKQEDPSIRAQINEFYQQLTPTALDYINTALKVSHKSQIRREMGITAYEQNKLLNEIFWKSVPTL